MNFMVVDDEAAMRAMVAAMLEQSGLAGSVVQCANAEDALLDLELQPVDFLVSDWNMPGMSGLDLLKRVRSAPELSHVNNIPVVLLTGVNSRQNVMDALRAGVTDYVVKPFTPSQLMEKIAVICRKRSDAASASALR